MASSPICTCPVTVSSAPLPPDLLSAIIRRDRWLIAGALTLLVGLCWYYLLWGAGMRDSGTMAGMGPVRPPFGALLLMWWLMMAAMMLPSAAPAILLYGQVRRSRAGDASIASTWLFLGGYLLAWLGFSLAAAGVQLVFAGPDMKFGNRWAEAALLIAAGTYQLSPLKSACLRQCRSPAQFISRHWRPCALGALRLGLLHGAYCVGCCWLLMALLFVGGVMSIVWIVALTAIVVIEKLLPIGDRIGRLTGIGLIVWGAIRLSGAA